MRIEFTVGHRERYSVEFFWGQLLGSVSIAIDGEVAFRGRPVALDEIALLDDIDKFVCDIVTNRKVPWQRIRSWDFELGETEKHHIRIEKERPFLLAAFRPHTFRVYVDGVMLVEQCGY